MAGDAGLIGRMAPSDMATVELKKAAKILKKRARASVDDRSGLSDDEDCLGSMSLSRIQEAHEKKPGCWLSMHGHSLLHSGRFEL